MGPRGPESAPSLAAGPTRRPFIDLPWPLSYIAPPTDAQVAELVDALVSGTSG